MGAPLMLRQVFSHDKYRTAWRVLNGAIADGLITPDDKSTLVAHSLEVKALSRT